MQLSMHVAFTMVDQQVLGYALRITILVNQNRIMCSGEGGGTGNIKSKDSEFSGHLFYDLFLRDGGRGGMTPCPHTTGSATAGLDRSMDVPILCVTVGYYTGSFVLNYLNHTLDSKQY